MSANVTKSFIVNLNYWNYISFVRLQDKSEQFIKWRPNMFTQNIKVNLKENMFDISRLLNIVIWCYSANVMINSHAGHLLIFITSKFGHMMMILTTNKYVTLIWIAALSLGNGDTITSEIATKNAKYLLKKPGY